VQALADVHDTPSSSPGESAGFGVGWIVQLVPSQRSANVTPPGWDPTAMQADADVHDTPSSTALVWPPPFGVGWIVQLVPSQRSANVAKARALLM
jgi:hypothetical protein